MSDRRRLSAIGEDLSRRRSSHELSAGEGRTGHRDSGRRGNVQSFPRGESLSTRQLPPRCFPAPAARARRGKRSGYEWSRATWSRSPSRDDVVAIALAQRGLRGRRVRIARNPGAAPGCYPPRPCRPPAIRSAAAAATPTHDRELVDPSISPTSSPAAYQAAATGTATTIATKGSAVSD